MLTQKTPEQRLAARLRNAALKRERLEARYPPRHKWTRLDPDKEPIHYAKRREPNVRHSYY